MSKTLKDRVRDRVEAKVKGYAKILFQVQIRDGVRTPPVIQVGQVRDKIWDQIAEDSHA